MCCALPGAGSSRQTTLTQPRPSSAYVPLLSLPRSAFFDADRVSRTGLLEALQKVREDQQAGGAAGGGVASGAPRSTTTSGAPAPAPASPLSPQQQPASATAARAAVLAAGGVSDVTDEWRAAPLADGPAAAAAVSESSAGAPSPGTGTLYIIGLAYDECVRYTAEDAAVLQHPGAATGGRDSVTGRDLGDVSSLAGTANSHPAGNGGELDHESEHFAPHSPHSPAPTFGSVASDVGGVAPGTPHSKAEAEQQELRNAERARELESRWRNVAVIEDGTRLIFEERLEEIRRTLEAMGVRVRKKKGKEEREHRIRGAPHTSLCCADICSASRD